MYQKKREGEREGGGRGREVGTDAGRQVTGWGRPKLYMRKDEQDGKDK